MNIQYEGTQKSGKKILIYSNIEQMKKSFCIHKLV